MSKRLGQSFYVENKPGAGSAIGCDVVAKAKPDGSTIMWSASDGISLLPAVKHNLPYRVPEDFTFIAMVTDFTELISVNSSLPIRTLKELVDYAKANPGRLRYGTAGVGGAPHLATVLFSNLAKVEMVHVPYGGVAPALTAVAGGHIDLTFAAPRGLEVLHRQRHRAADRGHRYSGGTNSIPMPDHGAGPVLVRFRAGFLMGPDGLPCWC